MASIQNLSSFSLQNNSSCFDMTPTICHCGGISKDLWGWRLPVSRRGHFFQDSFFEKTRAHFDAAVREVLGRCGETVNLSDTWHGSASSLVNNLNRYRQLRSNITQDENQATTVVSDNKSHKIVMDVHDFMDEEDIKVKVLGEREVLVEGQGKTKTGDGSLSSHMFSYRFTFPSSVNMSAITSVMSSDGVLTIEAPKMTNKENAALYETLEKTSKNVTENRTSLNTTSKGVCKTSICADSVGGRGINDSIFYCKGCNKKIGSWQKEPESKIAHQEVLHIPVKIDGSLTKNHQNVSQNQEAHSKSKEIKIERNEDSVRAKEMEKKDVTTNKQSSDQSNILTSTKNESQTSSSTDKNLYNIPISTCFNSLPIIRRGSFFNDSIFEDIHKDFQSAVQDILSRWGEEKSLSLMDNFSSYRNLRSRDLREENRAVKSVEDDFSHKLLLDVQDFLDGGKVTVKAINDRELVIDGRVEKQEGGSTSLKRLLKRFILPGDIKLDSVTSVMSSDGFLTITAPKKPPRVQLREVMIPVSIEELRENEETGNKKLDNLQDYIVSSPHPSDVNEPLILSSSSSLANSVSSSSSYQDAISDQIKPSKEHIIPINVEGTCCDTKMKPVNQVEIQKEVDERSFQNIQHQQEISQESRKSQANTMKEHIIPINVEGACRDGRINPVNRQLETQNESIEKSSETSQHQKDIFQASSTKENTHSSIMENKTDSALKQTDSHQISQQGIESVNNEEKNLTTNANERGLSSISMSRYLPITRRGVFFNDSFFEDYQKDFQNAVRDVLVKSRECVDVTDNMTVYRDLRQRNLKVENQALHVHEDQNSLKVVLDAKDFLNGDITVSVDGEELVIEGRAENNEVKSSNSLTFSHRFLLPEFADLSTITSAISSDGILTVNSPKKGNSSTGAVRKMASEARSKHESHDEGVHHLEEKNVKQSSEQSKGFSSSSFSSSFRSQQDQSSMF